MTELKGRILCVDDEPHVLRALQWLLKGDFEVHAAGSAAEGMQLLERHDFDVVVSDQRMPGVTGVEFLQYVRSRAPRAMRILLTGYSDIDAIVRSINESEVYRFATKPWNIRALPALIAEAAEIARATPEEVVAATEPEKGGGSVARQETAAGFDLRMSESILLIDDSPDARGVVTQAVGDTVPVLQASSPAEARAILQKQPVGVVLSDVRVGGSDVTSLVKLIKQERPEIVAVVLSREEDAGTIIGMINQGQVFRFLRKPLSPGLLKSAIDAALRRHRELVGNAWLRRRQKVEPIESDADTLATAGRMGTELSGCRPEGAHGQRSAAHPIAPAPSAGSSAGLAARLIAKLGKLVRSGPASE